MVLVVPCHPREKTPGMVVWGIRRESDIYAKDMDERGDNRGEAEEEE